MSSPQLPHFVRVKGEDELEVNLKACGLNNSSLWMSIHELQECLEQLPKRCQMKIDLSNNPDINDEGLECLVNFLDEHSSWVPRLKVAGTGMSGAGVAQLTSFIQRGGVQELDLSRLSSVDQAHVLDLLSTIRESGCYPQGKALPLLLQMDQNGLVDPEGIVAQAREMDVCCEVLSSQKELTEAQAKRAAAKSGASGETEIMVSLLFFYNQTPEPGSQPSSPSSPLKLKAKSAPEPPPPEKFTVPKAFSGKAEAPTIFPRSLGVPRPPEAPPPWDLLWGAAEAGKAAAMKHLETVFGSTTTPKSSGRVIPDMPSGPPPKTRPNAPRPSRAQWRSKSITPVPPPKTPPRSVSRDDLPPVPPPKPRTLEIPAFRPPPKPRPMAAMPSTNSDPPAGKKLTEVLMEVARNNDQATMGDKVISAPAGLEARRLLEKFTKKDSSSPARSQASSTSNKEESSLKWQSSTWHVQEWWKDWKKSDEQAACNPSKEEWSNDWNKSDEQAAWSSSKEESSWKNGSSSGKRWWEEAEKTQDSSSKGEKEWWNEWQKSDEQAAWNLSKEEWSNDWNKSDEQVAWSSSKEESSSWKNWSSEDWIKSSSGKQWWEEAEKTQDSSSKGEKEWWNEWQKSDEQAAWNLSKEETPGAMSDDADDVEEAVLGRHLLLLSDDDGRIESTPIPSSKDSIDSKNDLAERQQEHELGSFMALLKQCVSENEVNDDSGGSDQETTRRESPYDTYNDNDDDDDDDDESDEDEDPNAMAIAQNSRAIIDRLCGRQVRPSSSLPGKRGVSPGGPKEPPFPPPNKKRRTAATLRRNKARTKTHTIDGLKKMEEVEVSKLRYSQRSCKDKFQCGRSVEQLVKQLCSGEVSTSAAFLRLTVFEVVENGVPVLKCIDNRRLWALKEYAKRSGRKNVKVKIDLFSYDTLTQVQRFMMNSDDTDGRRVRLRKSPQEKRR